MAVDETKRIITHGDGQDIAEGLQNIALAIHSQAASSGSSTAVKSWAQIQQIVRSGLAPQVFSVGQQIEVEKESAVNATCTNGAISVTVDSQKFIAKMGTAKNSYVEFLHDGVDWTYGGEPVDLTEWGITASGTPEADDIINVHETATNIVFDVLGFDQETPADSSRTHSMTLGMHYTFTGVQFDAPEAFYYNGTSAALPAGTYNFTLGAHSWCPDAENTTWQFTLTEDLPVGGQLVFTQANTATLAGAEINVFASPSASTAAESVVISSGSSGTSLGTISNAGNATAYLNSWQRAFYGSNRWSQSAIRQWCNSKNAKGSVWKAQTGWDRLPSWATSLDGFLYGLDPELVSAIGKVKKTTELNTTSDGGGEETTEESVFLLSNYEIGSGAKSGYPAYKYWLNLLGGSAVGDWQTHAEFIKTNTAGSAQYWWLRSPHTGNANNARNVHASGNVNSDPAYIGFQAAVALSII